MADRKKIVDAILIGTITIFAFVFLYKSGERGFFPLDQSIVFDGAYRIIQGQIPYKDFLMPFGPVVFLIQSFFFRIFGINYFSYLLFSAISNVIGVLCSIFILRILFPEKKFLSYLAGLITGIWFYPPFGTPWLEQTSFLFSFLGIALVLRTLKKDGKYNDILFILSGVFSGLSILSKQNAGLFFLPVNLILFWSGNLDDRKDARVKNVILFSAGILGTFFVFLLWLVLFSEPNLFLQYFIKIPSELGLQRLFHNPSPIVVDLFTGRGLTSSRIVLIIFLLIAFYFLIRCLFHHEFQTDEKRSLLIASILYIYFTFYQNLFNHTTCNQDVNGFPFMGILLAIGTGLSIELFSLKPLKIMDRQEIKMVFYAGVVFSLFFIGMRGVEIALDRRVQDIFSNSRFPKYFAEEKLKNLRWGYPTIIEQTDVTEQSIIELINFLRQQKQNFFIFPDFTIFYGLLGVPSPQPLLWFQKEWIYTKDYNPKLDEWIVVSLKRNNVRIIVIEEKSFLGTEKRLNDFPLLKNYIAKDFQQKEKIGIFAIFHKIHDGNTPETSSNLLNVGCF